MTVHSHNSIRSKISGSGSRSGNGARVGALRKTVLSASIAACLGLSGLAHAQQDGIEEVVITGSRIVRRDFNAPSPILTVDAEAFEQTSNVSLEYVLNQYPQFNPDDTQFAASDVQPTAQNSPGASTLDMRGLGPSRSLVLLDGRRAQPVNAAMTVRQRRNHRYRQSQADQRYDGPYHG
jgi:outer membrane receptor for ferrienterochelin and colicin